MDELKERTIFHLHLLETGEHYYFGSMKRLCIEYGKDEIGIQYPSLRNFFAENLNIHFENKKCIIRKGILKTTETQRGKYERKK